MSGTSARDDTVQLGLGPVRRLEVEYYYVREMLAMLVLSTKDQQLIALPETRSMACTLLVYAQLVLAV